MERNFRIDLDLSNYYSDHRCKARLFINDTISRIKDLEKKISCLFEIKDFHLLCQNNYLPSFEDIRVLQKDDVIRVVSNDPEVNTKPKKKRKTEIIEEVVLNKEEKKSKKRKSKSEVAPIDEPQENECLSPKKKKNRKSVHISEVSTEKFSSTEDVNKDSKKRKSKKNTDSLGCPVEDMESQDQLVKSSNKNGSVREQVVENEAQKLNDESQAMLSEHCYGNKQSEKNVPINVDQNFNTKILSVSLPQGKIVRHYRKRISVPTMTDEYLKDKKVNIVKIERVDVANKSLKMDVDDNFSNESTESDDSEECHTTKSALIDNQECSTSLNHDQDMVTPHSSEVLSSKAGNKECTPSPNHDQDLVTTDSSEESSSNSEEVSNKSNPRDKLSKTSYFGDMEISPVPPGNTGIAPFSKLGTPMVTGFENCKTPFFGKDHQPSLFITSHNDSNARSEEQGDDSVFLRNLTLERSTNSPDSKLNQSFPVTESDLSRYRLSGVGLLLDQLRKETPFKHSSSVSDSLRSVNSQDDDKVDDSAETKRRKRVRKRRKRCPPSAAKPELPIGKPVPVMKAQLTGGTPKVHIRFNEDDHSFNLPTPIEEDGSVVSNSDHTAELESNKSSNNLPKVKIDNGAASISDEPMDNSLLNEAKVIKEESFTAPKIIDTITINDSIEESHFQLNQDFMLDEKKILSQPLMSNTLPRVSDVIAFKTLKINDDYTPTISKYIAGNVLKFDSVTKELVCKIIYGLDQCEIPQGKFSLELTEDEPVIPDNDIRKFKWSHLIEPRLLYP